MSFLRGYGVPLVCLVILVFLFVWKSDYFSFSLVDRSLDKDALSELSITEDSVRPMLVDVDEDDFAETIDFWKEVKRGANIFNKSISREDIKAAREYGIQFVRLAVMRFPTEGRDFLMGDAGAYNGLLQEDVDLLRYVLDMFAEENMPVVLTMVSLPGARWQQQNDNGQIDTRLWHEPEFLQQAARFWRDVAEEFHDHDAIVGFNIYNEPFPERRYSLSGEVSDFTHEAQDNLFDFYATVIEKIRSVSKTVPIILGSSAYASAQAMSMLRPHDDENILYDFHMYAPYEYTTYKLNKGRYKYPGVVNGKKWDKAALREYLQHVVVFQAKYKIPSWRIMVGEFGGNRKVDGLDEYFSDLVDLYDEAEWHRAFYAFRPDSWTGMDYELGSEKLHWSYWQALEEGREPDLSRSDDHPIFEALMSSPEED